MSKKLALILLVLAGPVACQEDSPSTDPPASWGVPISGGTMTISHDGHTAIVADPDRDRVLEVDLDAGKIVQEVQLAGDEPGRVLEDTMGRVHVVGRRGGVVVTLKSATDATILARRSVCAEPRGIAYQATSDSILVACTNGDLVTLPAAGGAETRRVFVDTDLRDVVVTATATFVSRFKTAELIQLDDAGAVAMRWQTAAVQRLTDTGPVPAIGAVAWRTIALADGSIVMSHQRQDQTILMTTHGGYGGNCGAPVESAVSLLPPGGVVATAGLLDTVTPPVGDALPVDLAINATGNTLAFVGAGAGDIITTDSSILHTTDGGGCDGGMIDGPAGPSGGAFNTGTTINDQLGIPTSVAFDSAGDVVAFYPELPGIVVHAATPRTIWLTGDTGYDSGRAMFHTQTAVGLACASCHPEGRDDGLVWQFVDEGTRRTQVPAGHILERAPYHWAGDMKDLPTLMDNVFSVRMAGGDPTHSELVSLGPWLERIPAPHGPANDPADAVARGKTLFESSATQCSTCHTGELMTNSLAFDVGTGGKFKVPSLLGVGYRAPYLHDGCAPTLADRFGPCGGGDQHGKTSQLSPADVSDLVAYLNSL
ncbi:MAG TPA: c-type cytochrome [Kofleriaceae bacterium]